MSKPVYMDFLGKREHLSDVPDDYHFTASDATAVLAAQHARWLSIESVTEDEQGVYVRAQLVVARAFLSPHFWWLIMRDFFKRLLNWKVG